MRPTHLTDRLDELSRRSIEPEWLCPSTMLSCARIIDPQLRALYALRVAPDVRDLGSTDPGELLRIGQANRNLLSRVYSYCIYNTNDPSPVVDYLVNDAAVDEESLKGANSRLRTALQISVVPVDDNDDLDLLEEAAIGEYQPAANSQHLSSKAFEDLTATQQENVESLVEGPWTHLHDKGGYMAVTRRQMAGRENVLLAHIPGYIGGTTFLPSRYHDHVNNPKTQCLKGRLAAYLGRDVNAEFVRNFVFLFFPSRELGLAPEAIESALKKLFDPALEDVPNDD